MKRRKVYCRQDHEKHAQKMLRKAKLLVRAFAMDQDGTLKGGDERRYKKANVAELLVRIAQKGKCPAVITASGVSALRSFVSLEAICQQKDLSVPIFVGIGNGAALYRFDKDGRTTIYNHELTVKEIKQIIKVWEQLYAALKIEEKDLQPKGLETFKEFIEADWEGAIPKEYLAIFKPYKGRCYTEKIKATVVLPQWEETSQRDLVQKLQAALDNNLGSKKYSAVRGNDTFLHITRSCSRIDTKLFALQAIMDQLKLNKNSVAAFGDMPLDNDKGLLIESGLRFSFTNKELNKKNIKKPPFILPGSLKTPVGSVYRAIDYLLA